MLRGRRTRHAPVPIRVRSEAPRPGAAPARPAGGIPARGPAVAAGDRVRLLRLAVDPQRAALLRARRRGAPAAVRRVHGPVPPAGGPRLPGQDCRDRRRDGPLEGAGRDRDARGVADAPERQGRPRPAGADAGGSAEPRLRRDRLAADAAGGPRHDGAHRPGDGPPRLDAPAREQPTAPTRRSKRARSRDGVPARYGCPGPGSRAARPTAPPPASASAARRTATWRDNPTRPGTSSATRCRSSW